MAPKIDKQNHLLLQELFRHDRAWLGAKNQTRAQLARSFLDEEKRVFPKIVVPPNHPF